jgi:predicted unusual protein kinase regulating ubiquinone biosynthesis (AarF/ABC1/UbiB family)
LDKYRVQSIREMNETGDVFVDMITIAGKYDMEVPMSLTMYGRSLLVMEGTVSDLDQTTDLSDIIGKHLAAYAIGDGVAGKIARKLSHRKLCSGARLRYDANAAEEVPEEADDRELLSDEEYRILSESGSEVWTQTEDN